VWRLLTESRLLKSAENLAQHSNPECLCKAKLLSCAGLAGWDGAYVSTTVAKLFLQAAALLETSESADICVRTYEASLRICSGLLLVLDAADPDSLAANLKRLVELRDLGVGEVANPADIRLRHFVAKGDRADGIDTHIATLEMQLAGLNYDGVGEDPGAIVACACGCLKLKLTVSTPRLRCECCCMDCNGITLVDHL
jgi:hypothetical protein